jgi:uncharacterized protein (TIGR00251 family)
MRNQDAAAGLRLEVLLQPRASREGLLGWLDGRLKVAVCAPPVDGQANAAVEALLAGELGLKRRQVRVVAGRSSRRKTLMVDGLEAGALERLLKR